MRRQCALLLALIAFAFPLAAAALSVGDRVQATANLNVRASPSTSATLIGTVPAYSLGTITLGPTVNTYTWWQVKWDQGLSGWSVQNYLQKTSTQTTTTVAPTSQTTSLPTIITSSPTTTAQYPTITAKVTGASQVKLVFVDSSGITYPSGVYPVGSDGSWAGTAVTALSPGTYTVNLYDQDGITGGSNGPLLTSGTLTVSVAPPISTVCSGIAGPSVRSTADQTDDSSDYQIHVVYAIPSDGVDNHYDTNSAIANSVSSWEHWLCGQTGGQGLKLDTYKGQLDITFVKFDASDSTIKTGADSGYTGTTNPYVRDDIEARLRQLGMIKPNKLYVVYYGGSSNFSCGGGAWPPSLPGQVAALYAVDSSGHSVPSCGVLGANPLQSGFMDISMLHETMHTLGIDATCSSHHTRSGHVSDTPTDLMWAGDQPWTAPNVVLDYSHDDYYLAHIPSCTDLSNSIFFTGGGIELPSHWGEWTNYHIVSALTAKLTANGAKNITVSTGAPVTFRWSSTGAVSAAGTYTAIPADTCRANALAVPMTVASSTYRLNAVPLCAAGHTYTFTYTVQSSTSQTATSSVKVRVATTTTALLDHDSQVAAVLATLQSTLMQILDTLDALRGR